MSQLNGTQRSIEREVLMVVFAKDTAARDEGIAVVAAEYITPGAVLGTAHIEIKGAVAIKVFPDFLVSFGKKSQIVFHTAILYTVIITFLMLIIEVGNTAIGRTVSRIEIEGHSCCITALVPDLLLVAEAIRSGGDLGFYG